jgi:glycosyltransferase involved in cell wall biosynthesis
MVDTPEDTVTKKKTLLIATDSFLPRWDGISRFLYELLPFLEKEFDVIVAAPRFQGTMPELGNVAVVRFPTYKTRIADTFPAKFKHIQVKKLVAKADIVWSQSIGPIGALAMYYAKKQNKPLVSFVHSVEWFLFSKSLKRFKGFVELTIRKMIPFLYNKCDLIMVPFEGMMPMLDEQGVKPKKEIVLLGIDTNKFRPTESKILAKERVGLDPNKIVIGYLGRFGREKDIKTLYEAFRKVHQDRPNTTLLLVGGKIEFDDMNDVMVVDSTSETLKYYHSMDIYVLPSLTETTSLTTMEAMSSGLPVVVTPVGYVEKYVENKFNGFVFPFGNPDRLYLILKKLVSDLHLRKEMGRAARNTMVQKASWQKTADEIVDILKRF